MVGTGPQNNLRRLGARPPKPFLIIHHYKKFVVVKNITPPGLVTAGPTGKLWSDCPKAPKSAIRRAKNKKLWSDGGSDRKVAVPRGWSLTKTGKGGGTNKSPMPSDLQVKQTQPAKPLEHRQFSLSTLVTNAK